MKKNVSEKDDLFYGGRLSSKLLLSMKICFFLLLVSFMQVSAHVYSQERFTLNYTKVNADKILDKIQKESSYRFFYTYDDIKKLGKVNINVKDATLSDIMNSILANGLTWKILQNNMIVISSQNEINAQITVGGTVTDTTGAPLIGVTIKVKGENKGVVTDGSGKFTIVVPENAVLEVSYIGYQTIDVPVNGQSSIHIIMKPGISTLNQLVVVGYGSQKKGDLTGSISSISNSSFQHDPIIRVSDAIKGRAAGVFVQTPNGAPGAGVKIRIRGANSINGDNDPLYVIDGFVGGDINTINPDDIASIEILKDASATAIYGSRGANGVIIITTKTGQANKPRVDLNVFYSFDKVSKTLNLLNGSQYMEMVNAQNQAVGLNPLFTDSQIAAVKRTGGTDWQNAVLRTGNTQNYELSFSGGSGKTNYYLSGNIANQQGIILNSWDKRYSLRVNLGSSVGKKFHIKFDSYGTFENSRNNYSYSGRNTPYGQALVFPPNIPVFDSTGNYTTTPPSYGPVAGNPIFSANTQNFDSRIFTILSNAKLSYDINNHLQLSVSGGLNGSNYNTPSFKQAAPGTPLSTSQGEYDNGFSWALQNTNELHYENTFGGIHKLEASVIYEQQQSFTNTDYVIVSTFPTISLGYNNLGLGLPFRAGSGYSDWSIQSYLGRINYQLMSKYLFTVTFRADGSSKFQGKNKYGYFPSGAFAWKISDEPFLRNANVFQSLKLRVSYGLTGSQAIGPYQTLTVLVPGDDYLFDGATKTVGIGAGTPGNPNLKWETTAQADLGLDFIILNNRLSGTMDYYQKKTTGLLMPVPIPAYNGGGSIVTNVGSLQNRGFEILLQGVIINHHQLKINTSVNLSLNRNKILSLGANQQIITDGGYTGLGTSTATPFILKEGYPLGELYGLVYEGLWQTKEASEATLYGNVPGDPKYKDMNNDQKINGSDMIPIGNTQPKFTYGWNSDISLANFDLNLFFTGVQGNKVWNFTRYLIQSTSSDIKYPTSKEILNHWTPSNINTNIPGFSSTNGSHVQSTEYLENGSYLRLSNVTLGYNLSPNILRRWKMNNALIYLSAQNLFIITKYQGEDPELSNASTSTDVAAGIDFATYPAFRTFTIGIKLGF